MDLNKNRKINFITEDFINTDDSVAKILVLCIDEELGFARETMNLIKI